MKIDKFIAISKAVIHVANFAVKSVGGPIQRNLGPMPIKDSEKVKLR